MTETHEPEHVAPSKPVLSNQAYDVLKYIAQIVLPGAGTFYFALAQIWGMPDAAKVVGSITAADVFLGLLLGLTSLHYARTGAAYDGDMDVANVDGVTKFQLNLNDHPEHLVNKDKIVFKVKPVTDIPATNPQG